MLRGMPSLDPYREQAVQVCTAWGWGAGAEKPAESHGDRARLPEARDFSSQGLCTSASCKTSFR